MKPASWRLSAGCLSLWLCAASAGIHGPAIERIGTLQRIGDEESEPAHGLHFKHPVTIYEVLGGLRYEEERQSLRHLHAGRGGAEGSEGTQAAQEERVGEGDLHYQVPESEPEREQCDEGQRRFPPSPQQQPFHEEAKQGHADADREHGLQPEQPQEQEAGEERQQFFDAVEEQGDAESVTDNTQQTDAARLLKAAVEIAMSTQEVEAEQMEVAADAEGEQHSLSLQEGQSEGEGRGQPSRLDDGRATQSLSHYEKRTTTADQYQEEQHHHQRGRDNQGCEERVRGETHTWQAYPSEIEEGSQGQETQGAGEDAEHAQWPAGNDTQSWQQHHEAAAGRQQGAGGDGGGHMGQESQWDDDGGLQSWSQYTSGVVIQQQHVGKGPREEEVVVLAEERQEEVVVAGSPSEVDFQDGGEYREPWQGYQMYGGHQQHEYHSYQQQHSYQHQHYEQAHPQLQQVPQYDPRQQQQQQQPRHGPPSHQTHQQQHQQQQSQRLPRYGPCQREDQQHHAPPQQQDPTTQPPSPSFYSPQEFFDQQPSFDQQPPLDGYLPFGAPLPQQETQPQQPHPFTPFPDHAQIPYADEQWPGQDPTGALGAPTGHLQEYPPPTGDDAWQPVDGHVTPYDGDYDEPEYEGGGSYEPVRPSSSSSWSGTQLFGKLRSKIGTGRLRSGLRKLGKRAKAVVGLRTSPQFPSESVGPYDGSSVPGGLNQGYDASGYLAQGQQEAYYDGGGGGGGVGGGYEGGGGTMQEHQHEWPYPEEQAGQWAAPQAPVTENDAERFMAHQPHTQPQPGWREEGHYEHGGGYEEGEAGKGGEEDDMPDMRQPKEGELAGGRFDGTASVSKSVQTEMTNAWDDDGSGPGRRRAIWTRLFRWPTRSSSYGDDTIRAYEADDEEHLEHEDEDTLHADVSVSPVKGRRRREGAAGGLALPLQVLWENGDRSRAVRMVAAAVTMAVVRVGIVYAVATLVDHSALNPSYGFRTEATPTFIESLQADSLIRLGAVIVLALLHTYLSFTISSPLTLMGTSITRTLQRLTPPRADIPDAASLVPLLGLHASSALRLLSDVLTLVLLAVLVAVPGVVQWPKHLALTIPGVTITSEMLEKLPPPLQAAGTTLRRVLEKYMGRAGAAPGERASVIAAFKIPPLVLKPQYILPLALLFSVAPLSLWRRTWKSTSTLTGSSPDHPTTDTQSHSDNTRAAAVERLLLDHEGPSAAFEVRYRGMKAWLTTKCRAEGGGDSGGRALGSLSVMDRLLALVHNVLVSAITLAVAAALVYELNTGRWNMKDLAMVAKAVVTGLKALREGSKARLDALRARKGGLEVLYELLELREGGEVHEDGALGAHEETGHKEEEDDTSGWTTDGPRPEDGIMAEGLWVRPPEGDYVVKDLNVQAKPGQITVICGSEAAGKSLLLQAMAGLTPSARTRGGLSFQGRDLQDWDGRALKRRVAYLPPIELSATFPLTVRENVMAGDDVKSETVDQAARAAGLERVVQAMPEGYDTELGVDGGRRGLCSGEWRRVQLARALAWKDGKAPPPQLILLDEPTLLMSDEEAMLFISKLRQAMASWGTSTTVVIATQRPSLVPYSDHVVILHEGRLIQSGPPQAVLPTQWQQQPQRTQPVAPHRQPPPSQQVVPGYQGGYTTDQRYHQWDPNQPQPPIAGGQGGFRPY